ncbi:MAG: bifunctional aldolase/short-chain dehydrogenase [Gammaproteobacteria bacterium]|nr:bifunctional aldolase/short-chain dehydrogenase [Gammaproteobacteria bacterium]
MKSLWDEKEAKNYIGDPVQERVYSSRVLGRDPDLVLHGGGNTSVKASAKNLFGEEEELLFVKGSGWDLISIEAAGFPGVKLDLLNRLAELDELSDTNMVKAQKSAMIDPSAPTPSVEAILHALIPYKYVDHTHADAVITITNTAKGLERIKEIYGDTVLIIPYVMPGFILAQTVRDLSKNIDWSKLKGMILMNHGVFSFADDARTSYEYMIELVSKAEDYLQHQGAEIINKQQATTYSEKDLLSLAKLRQVVSAQMGNAMVVRSNIDAAACSFASLDNVESIATRGPLTPDHVIRTKRIPLIMGDDPLKISEKYQKDYEDYFNRNTDGALTCLDTAPRWAVWPDKGTLAFGRSVKEADIIADITEHTIKAIQQAERLGGWQALSEKDIFDVEYWELEQAKLKKTGSALELQGKVALVSGAASGIGKACVKALCNQGVAVIALDIDSNITSVFNNKNVLGLVCDVTDEAQIKNAITQGVQAFGGLDILVNNAGIFPASLKIETMSQDVWNKSIAINLTAHELILKHCIPFLRLGIEPAVIFMASKNVLAPGPGASAYSVAKAGFTQLARVAAMELAGDKIRVNILHPDAVFDTAIWTDEVLQKRADSYGMTIQEYKTKNLLKTEITSYDVANLVCAMAGPLFSKTTGAQVPIDGGNDRVI